MEKLLNILIIEDNESDALLNIRQLQKAGYSIRHLRVETEEAMREALKTGNWDLVLADYQLPRFDAPNAFRVFRESDIDIPFIVISGVIGEDRAVEMMKAGVHDYFVKGNLTRFVSAVERELREAQIRHEQFFTYRNIQIQHKLSLSLSKSRTMHEAMQLLMEAVSQIEGIDSGGIYLFEKPEMNLRLVYQQGLNTETEKIVSYYDKNSRNVQAVLTGKANYLSVDEGTLQTPEIIRDGFKSAAVIPISTDGQLIGCLNLASRRPETFGNIVQIAVESIVSETGGTISRLQAEQAQREIQRDLQLLFDSIDDIIFIMDMDGNILETNPSVRKKLEYSEEEMLTMSVLSMFAEPFRDEGVVILKEITEGKRNNCPLPLQTRNGQLIPVDTHVTIGTWRNRNVLIGISRDISEQQKTQEALVMSELRFRRIFEDATIGLATIDPAFHFIRCNTAFCNFIGYTEEELNGMTFADITHPDHLEDDRAGILQLTQKKRKSYRTEKRYVTKNGQVAWGSLVASIITDSSGRILHILAMVEDITERKKAEAETLRWKNHYEVVSTTSGQAVYDYHYDSGMIFWGGNTAQVLGYSSEEFGHIDLWEALVHPDDRDHVLSELSKVSGCGDSFNTRYRFLHKDGTYRYIHDKGVVVCDADGTPKSLVGMMQDITSMVLAEKELLEKEERYRKLFELSPSGITLEDTEGNILAVNEAFCNATGYTREELVNQNVRKLIPEKPNREKQITRDISRILTGKVHKHEVLNVRKDGTLLYVELNEQLITLPDGRQGILAVSNDITPRKQAEELMQESRRQLEIFAQHLQEAREEERILLARELHDNLGQNLTALKIDVARILKRIREAPSTGYSEQVIRQAGGMLELIDATIDLVRKISSDLRPRVLDELGIVSAIEWQIHEFTKLSGIPCTVVIDHKNMVIPPEFSVGVFRIFQEMLTNIIRHSGATKVQISLRKKYNSVILEVEDNGKGIPPEKINDHKSLGLIGMRERALLFGGSVVISGKPGNGSHIRLTIPTKKNPE